jgi:hypothetical protein
LSTPTHGLLATSDSLPAAVTVSGFLTGCASGVFPGHIGICVCPGEGANQCLRNQVAKTKYDIESKKPRLHPISFSCRIEQKSSHPTIFSYSRFFLYFYAPQNGYCHD